MHLKVTSCTYNTYFLEALFCVSHLVSESRLFFGPMYPTCCCCCTYYQLLHWTLALVVVGWRRIPELLWWLIAMGTCDRGNMDGTSTHSHTQPFENQVLAGICMRDTRLSRVVEPLSRLLFRLFQQPRRIDPQVSWKSGYLKENQNSQKASVNHWHFMHEPMVSPAVIWLSFL